MTLSEKRMEKLDLEIKKQIEEAVMLEKRRMKVDLFKSESSSSIQKKPTIESKIKDMRRIDPEFLIHLKQKDFKTLDKEDLTSVLNLPRSISTFNLSPSESRASPLKKDTSQSTWHIKMEKKIGDDSKYYRPIINESNNYSSLAKEFLKEGLNMQKSLRCAFRNKVNVKPEIIYKAINSTTL